MNEPKPSAFIGLLVLCGALGVAVALVFLAFEWALEHTQHWLWHTVAGDHPGWLITIGITTIGALVMGLLLRFLPGHGGPHPAEGHGALGAGADVALARPRVILSVLVVGFIGLGVGASLGPEGAILPAIAGLSVFAAHRGRIEGPAQRLVMGAGLGALLAAMFGSPLAGVVPLLEAVPVAPGAAMAMLVLPALTASATATIVLQVLDVEPAGFLPFTYSDFQASHLLWAVLIGVVAGAAGLLVDRAMRAMRVVTRRIDSKSVVLTAVVGGLGLGALYVIGGETVRFSGIPELLGAVATTDSGWRALLLAAIKITATAWCLAAGFRGGKIFPAAYIGGMVGLALHLFVHAIPIEVAWGVGLAAAMATALGTPVLAVLVVASVESPAMLPLAVVGVVAAHTVHLLGDQLRAAQQSAEDATAVG